MFKFAENHSLFFKFKFSFSALLLLSTICVSISIFISVNSIHQQDMTTMATDTVVLMCSTIQKELSEARRICDNISQNNTLQNYLRLDFQDSPSRYSTDLSGNLELLATSHGYDTNRALYVLGENGGQYKSNISSFYSDDLTSEAWYQTTLSNDNYTWFYTPTASAVVRTTDSAFLYVGKPFIDHTSGEKLGIILVEIFANKIFTTTHINLNSYGTLGLYDLHDSEQALLMSFKNSSQEEVLTNAQLAFLQDNISQENTIYTPNIVSNDGTLYVTMNIENSPWTVVASIAQSDLQIYSTGTILSCLLLLLLVEIIAMHICSSLSLSFSQPIHSLAKRMKKVEAGDYSIRFPVERTDEIGELTQGFNAMVSKIESSVADIYQTQTKLREVELKAMQAQINPHFLYNSLDSIIWLLKIGQTQNAIEMLNALTVVFRIALSKGKDVISLASEIQFVKSYLTIQHMRYSEKFDFSIVLDATIENCQVIKFLLQPLVENAIYHGLDASCTKLNIEIRAEATDDQILLTVSDDGCGIPSEKLKELNQQFATPGKSPSHGYGLHNVNARIKILCGAQYGLTLISEDGVGTTACLNLPFDPSCSS